MNINFDILEQFRQYYNGELSSAEARALENKIASDEVYAYHQRVFKTLSQGVSQSVAPDKEWMSDLKNKPATEFDINNIENIIATDKASYRRRIFLFMGLMILAIAGIALVVWKPWEPVHPTIEQNSPPRLQADELEEEEEPLIGSTGVSVVYDIEQRIYNPGPPPVLIGRKNRVLNLQEQSAPALKYEFRSDTLVLYSNDAGKFNRASFDWIALQTMGAAEDFLRIDADFYAIPPVTGKQLLQRAGKERSATLKSLKIK